MINESKKKITDRDINDKTAPLTNAFCTYMFYSFELIITEGMIFITIYYLSRSYTKFCKILGFPEWHSLGSNIHSEICSYNLPTYEWLSHFSFLKSSFANCFFMGLLFPWVAGSARVTVHWWLSTLAFYFLSGKHTWFLVSSFLFYEGERRPI